MTESIAAQTFLNFTEALVFGVLCFLLWMFYRGFGRQYVKLWTLSLGFKSLNHLVRTVEAQFLLVPDYHPLKIVLTLVDQASSYLYLIFLILGLYAAKKMRDVSNKYIGLYSVVATAIAIIATLTCATAPDHVLDRFFMRVSLQAFIFGAAFVVIAAFVIWNRPHHFSSRIFTYLAMAIAIESLTYSFASTLALNEWWFPYLTTFTTYFNVGAGSLLAFSMLIWMQGAERRLAVSALNQAQYLGKHDSLTGTLNRVQVLEKLPALIESTLAADKKLCVILIDIKRFKFINDTYGLKIGDYILGEVANRLRNSIFKPSIVGRLSGDSFVLTIDYDVEQQIEHVTNHIHELIGRPFSYEDQDIIIQCSLGYCSYPDYADSAEDSLQNANLALFHAESHNLATTGFSNEMQVQGRHLLEMEKAIKAGLQNEEFELYFQPQLNLLTNKLEGVEALVRWNHPEKGLLTPYHFLNDVDALNLNSQFDVYILEKACQAHKRIYDEFKRRITIAVNITAVEFQDPKLISTIQSFLLSYEMPPKYLELEITENVVMTDLRSAMDTIVILQNMGIKVSIDDFGTGYSSLAYLRQLPIDKIKIDRSFIQEMTSNDSDITIVSSMIKLSHGLGKRVLAEGVETNAQLELLRNLGCDAVQGYFISKPVSEQRLAQYFSRKKTA